VPSLLLLLGAAVQFTRPAPVRAVLRQPLATVPADFEGFQATDIAIDTGEVRVSGVDDYLMREYRDDAGRAYSVYVGYHAAQDQDNQVHSPRNCLPGAGWQVLTAETRAVAGGTVNRYLLEFNGLRALVLYWYQGRGRVAANEFAVKLHLLRDVATTGRSDEALVRIVLPLGAMDSTTGPAGFTEEDAERLGLRVATALVPALQEVLP
jgi:EpsI family protein